MGVYPCKHCGALFISVNMTQEAHAPTCPLASPRCGKYLGDNDGTCPQLTCIRERGHGGLCDNVRAD